MIGGKIGATRVPYILVEIHHRLDVLFTALVVLKSLKFLLCKSELIGSNRAYLRLQSSASLLEGNLTIVVETTYLEHTLYFLTIYLRKILIHAGLVHLIH